MAQRGRRPCVERKPGLAGPRKSAWLPPVHLTKGLLVGTDGLPWNMWEGPAAQVCAQRPRGGAQGDLL